MARSRSIQIKIKRIYEAPARADGCRVLVDHIWPRGISKDTAQLDAWLKELAPSAELRKWFGHEPPKWASFKRKYFRELDQKGDVLPRLFSVCGKKKNLTLLFAAKDCEHNNAQALKEYVDRLLATPPRE